VREVVLVPIKSFTVGKSRLRDHLTGDDVVALMQRLARDVIAACRPTPCWVLCDDDDVALFATECGARDVRAPSSGLNDAVAHGYQLASEQHDRVIIAHADLIVPASLGAATFSSGATIATDRHGTGTNVLVLPTGLDFTFFYGVGSARAHESEATRLGLAVTVLTASGWAADLDEPADLALLPPT
jgi:2-phospho-L-lactate guanylyltransferase